VGLWAKLGNRKTDAADCWVIFDQTRLCGDSDASLAGAVQTERAMEEKRTALPSHNVVNASMGHAAHCNSLLQFQKALSLGMKLINKRSLVD
jgi:hypothetical protein